MRHISRQTRMLTLGVFLTMTGLTLVAPILPLYAREFGVSRTAAGALISSFAVARLVFDLAGGVAADRFGARRVMIAGASVLSAASVGAALAPNYWLLLVTRVLEGFGSAAFATAAMQLIVVTTPKERLGRTMAFYQTGLLAGISVGPVVGGFAAQVGDFTTPFWLYAAIGLVVALVVAKGVESAEVRPGKSNALVGIARQLLRQPAFVALMFVTFSIFVMRAGARITLLPLYGGEELGLSESRIGIVIAVAAFVNVLVVNPGGWLVDKVGRRPILVLGLLLTAVAIGAHGFVTSFAGLVVVSVGFGLTASLMGIPPPTMAGDLAPPGAEGAAVGLYRTAGDIGLIAGPVLMGSIAEGGAFMEGFLVAGGLLVAAAVVSLAVFDPGRRGLRSASAVEQ